MRAVIVGINGQDGHFLSQHLAMSDIEVLGVTNPRSVHRREIGSSTIAERYNVDLARSTEAEQFFDKFRPDLIFHLAAVHAPSQHMAHTEKVFAKEMFECHVGITSSILNWQLKNRKARSVIALSSQMYSQTNTVGEKISEVSVPTSEEAYGKTKSEAWRMLQKFRENHSVTTSGVILFNHSSTWSKRDFLFPTLAREIHEVSRGLRSEVTIRNPLAHIDISAASEVTQGILSVGCTDTPGDFVLGSGRTQTIDSIIRDTSRILNIDIPIAASEIPIETQCLQSDIGKARKMLKWNPKISAPELLAFMVLNNGSNHDFL